MRSIPSRKLGIRRVATNGCRILLAAGFALALLGQDSLHARKAYFDAFVSAYPDLRNAAKEAKCYVCHVGNNRKNRNDYGTALASALGGRKNLKEGDAGIATALKAIEGEQGVKGSNFATLIKAGELPGTEPLARARLAPFSAPPEARRPPPADVAPWMSKLAAADPRVRLEAATALARLGPKARPAFEALTTALADRDRNVRFVAGQALDDVSNPDEEEPLEELAARLNALGAAEKPHERANAVSRLGALGPTAELATRAIARELEEGHPLTRSSAIIALGQIGPGAIAAAPALGKLAEKGSEEDSFEAALALSFITATDGLFARGKPAEIAEAERRAVARLIKALSARQAERQIDGALALSRLGPAAFGALPELTAQLKAKDPETVYASARALASITHESRELLWRVDPLDGTILTEEDQRIATALFRLRKEVDHFERSLLEGAPAEQFEAARVLATVDPDVAGINWKGGIVPGSDESQANRAGLVCFGRLALVGDAYGLYALDRALKSREVEIRLATVEMLGDLLETMEFAEEARQAAAIKVLKRCAADNSVEVRNAAEQRLKAREKP